jgi:hypothetical protein
MILEDNEVNMIHIKDIEGGTCFKTNFKTGDDSCVFMKLFAYNGEIFKEEIVYPAVNIESGNVFSFSPCKVIPIEIVAREKRG